LLREGLEAILPDDLEAWVDLARVQREKWKAAGVPIELRRGLLLAALVAKYSTAAAGNASPLPSRGEGQGEGSERPVGSSAGKRKALGPLTPALSPRGEREGFVSLVGAGPGDPGLLTQRGA